MADVSNQTIAKISRGLPIRVYLNPTINTDGTITLTASGTLDGTAHVNAKEIGYTQDGFELTRSTTVEGLPTDQTKDEVVNSLAGQDVRLKTTMLQIRDYANLVLLNPGMVAVTGTGFSGIADNDSTVIATCAVACVAPTPNDATKFKVIIGYACYNVAPFNEKLAREYNRTPLELKVVNAGRTDRRTFFSYETV